MSSLADLRLRRQLVRFRDELRFRQLREDPFKFYEHVRIETPAAGTPDGMTTYDPTSEQFDYQLEIIEALRSPKAGVVSVKTRQVGFTETVMVDTAWLMSAVKPGFKAALVSLRQDDANAALAKLKGVLRNLPGFIAGRYKLRDQAQNYVELEFPDGRVSRCIAFSATANPGVGYSLDRVILDEFALVKPQSLAEETIKALEPTLAAINSSSHCRWATFVVFSSSRGGSTRHGRLYKAAASGELAGWIPIFIPRSKSPFLTADEFEKKLSAARAQGSEHEVLTEYPETIDEAFLSGAGKQFFPALPPEAAVGEPGEADGTGLRGWIKPKGENTVGIDDDPTGPWRLKSLRPDPDADYLLYADPSVGRGGDAISVHLLAIYGQYDIEIVGYFHDHQTEPSRVAQEMARIGKHFVGQRGRPATISWEVGGGYGGVFERVLRDEARYPRLWVREKEGGPTTGWTYKFGWLMSKSGRPAALETLRDYLTSDEHTGDIGLRGVYPILRGELSTFVINERGRPEAAAGEHDDTVMSLAGALAIAHREAPRGANRTTRTDSEGEGELQLEEGKAYARLPIEDYMQRLNPTPRDKARHAQARARARQLTRRRRR